MCQDYRSLQVTFVASWILRKSMTDNTQKKERKKLGCGNQQRYTIGFTHKIKTFIEVQHPHKMHWISMSSKQKQNKTNEQKAYQEAAPLYTYND